MCAFVQLLNTLNFDLFSIHVVVSLRLVLYASDSADGFKRRAPLAGRISLVPLCFFYRR